MAGPTGLVAAAFGAEGPRLSPSTACSSSAVAIGVALGWIRSGVADVVLAGGADSLTRMTYCGFHALQAMSPEPCRPFDQNRQGMSLGEGAAMLVLESESHARARGARILAELAGAGLSCDASHLTAPHPEGRGAVRALECALRDAGEPADAIDYVNAHGTATPQNDVVETRALKQVLGERAWQVPISSTKSLVGHLLGAAGAIEAVVSVLAITDRFIPPTFSLSDADPECDLDYVPGRGRELTSRVVVSSSYGFGGNNSSLVFRAHGESTG